MRILTIFPERNTILDTYLNTHLDTKELCVFFILNIVSTFIKYLHYPYQIFTLPLPNIYTTLTKYLHYPYQISHLSTDFMRILTIFYERNTILDTYLNTHI